MAAFNPPRPPAAASAGAATPRSLRLLERAEPLPLRSPTPAPTWSARLGRWVDRLLVP